MKVTNKEKKISAMIYTGMPIEKNIQRNVYNV